MNQELRDYIKKTRESGFKDEQIKQELLKVGWKEADVNQAFNNNFDSVPVPKPEKINNRKPKALVIALVVVIAIILIGGGIFGYKYLIKPSGPKNYGNNFNDFISAAKNCFPSKVEWVGSATLGLDIQTVKHEIELKGLDSDQNCILVDKNMVTELKMSEKAKQLAKQVDPANADVQIKQYEADALIYAKETGDVTITCYFDVNYITQALTNLSKNIIFLADDFVSGHCTAISTDGTRFNVWGSGVVQLDTKSEIKDCGVVENVNSINPLDSQSLNNVSNQTRESLKCIDNALINCQLAKINLGGKIYEIKGKENQNCLVALPLKSDGTNNKTCKVPLDMILEAKTTLETYPESQGLIFLATASAISTTEQMKNKEGVKIYVDFDCK